VQLCRENGIYSNIKLLVHFEQFKVLMSEGRRQCLSEGSLVKPNFTTSLFFFLLPVSRTCDAFQLIIHASMLSVLGYFRPRERISVSMDAQRPDGSPGLSPVRTNETTALLGEEHGRAQFLLHIPLYLYHTIKATIYCSKANFLLVFVPLSVIAAAQEWHPVAVFALSFLAIFPLAELLSWSTEQLSASVGQTLGGLLTATFGNAVEMIVTRAGPGL
jgi:hypothetical protein